MNRNEFVETYENIVQRALDFSEKARREGLLATEDDIDGEKADKRDIFEYGMRFVVDGVEYEIIRKILTNIIGQEKDEQMSILKNIQGEAVLAIQAGINTRLVYGLLNSYTDIAIGDDKFKNISEM
jgi:flagellar motor component MotA